MANGPLAQLVEQLTLNQRATGSSPVWFTIGIFAKIFAFFRERELGGRLSFLLEWLVDFPGQWVAKSVKAKYYLYN